MKFKNRCQQIIKFYFSGHKFCFYLLFFFKIMAFTINFLIDNDYNSFIIFFFLIKNFKKM